MGITPVMILVRDAQAYGVSWLDTSTIRTSIYQKGYVGS